ncbi:hypothetical protein BAUCODRAFT_225759 [Baudoinia panamericana UAMH 10762]|uniref:Uncharacterized protein n=1 Tax=Baudoinia panamericana (strain UAMH 10762) TaxID=717646 RepID=M2N612_BAUPA|nr:uncharacterized protein BAUCODRAFT_225759 [Baudoinia panamericana UAMH 10762]EMC94220.1 hypothetical protein BAUCODRAFT_225759 [Baudoinia panamericana UAMH 10762]
MVAVFVNATTTSLTPSTLLHIYTSPNMLTNLAGPNNGPCKVYSETIAFSHAHRRYINIETNLHGAVKDLEALQTQYATIPDDIRSLLQEDADLAICDGELECVNASVKLPLMVIIEEVLVVKDEAEKHLRKAMSRYLPRERGEMQADLNKAKAALGRADQVGSSIIGRLLDLKEAVTAHEEAVKFFDTKRVSYQDSYSGSGFESESEYESSEGESEDEGFVIL